MRRRQTGQAQLTTGLMYHYMGNMKSAVDCYEEAQARDSTHDAPPTVCLSCTAPLPPTAISIPFPNLLPLTCITVAPWGGRGVASSSLFRAARHENHENRLPQVGDPPLSLGPRPPVLASEARDARSCWAPSAEAHVWASKQASAHVWESKAKHADLIAALRCPVMPQATLSATPEGRRSVAVEQLLELVAARLAQCTLRD